LTARGGGIDDVENDDRSSELALKLVLRWIGTASLLALPFVFAPYEWMDTIHRALGLGRLPDAPVVGYLARSTSALYALIGGLFWAVSLDLRRHRRILVYLGAAIASFGVALFVVDWWEGLPLPWKLWEGPFVTAVGLAILFLGRCIRSEA
jgi:hypothetical protein